MVNYFKNNKENYLLLGAIIFYCTYLIIFIIQQFFFVEDDYFMRFDGNISIKKLLISAVIFAPIIEEIIFRGYFTKNKFLRILSLIGLPIFSYFTVKEYFIIIILYVFILSYNILRPKSINQKIIYILSALIFAFVHYEPSDFKSFFIFSPIFAQFAMGMFLLWLVLNYNLKKAIFFHFLHNFLLMIPVFFMLQFPDIKVSKIQSENYELIWSKNKLLNNNTKIIKPNLFNIEVSNLTPIDFYKLFSKSKNIKLKNSEPFYKFNLQINKLGNGAKELDSVIVKSLLIKAKLIKEIN